MIDMCILVSKRSLFILSEISFGVNFKISDKMKNKTIHFLIGLFVTCTLNSQTVSTITEGLFHDGLALDSTGNLYGSDYAGDAVFKMDTSGNVTTFVSGLNTPNGIGVNSIDEIYICDHESNKIIKYDTSGNEIASFSATTPAGIKKMPNSDDMIFVEYGTNKINLLKTDGTITQLFEGSPINGPAGIAFDDNDVAYIANFNDRKIYQYVDGAVTYVAQLPAGAFNNNFLGFLTYTQGFLYATQLGENRIYKINPEMIDDFEVYTGSAAGNMDGDISEATFNFPNGILASPDGNTIYITDAGTKNLRIISDVTLTVNEFIAQDFSLKLYPNPSKEVLNIKGTLPNQRDFDITVYDTLGKQVFLQSNTFETEIFEKNIDISNWKSGVYMVVITSGKFKASKKVVK